MTIHDFATGIAMAAWDLNLTQFCTVIDNDEDDYAKEKFDDLRQLARYLNRFDDATLTKLLRAGGVEA
jgi:hypothetical protein